MPGFNLSQIILFLHPSMYCKKFIHKSSTITAIKKIIYANSICLAIAKKQKLYICTLEMKKIFAIEVYADIFQIIPLSNKFVCFSNSYSMEVSETSITKQFLEYSIEYDRIVHTIDTKNYCMFIYDTALGLYYSKAGNKLTFEGPINDFYQMSIIDIFAEGNHLYILHKCQDKYAKSLGNEILYTNVLSYYKYHNKQFVLIDSVDAKENLKIVVCNRTIFLFGKNNLYKVVMNNSQTQLLKTQDTDENDKTKLMRKTNMKCEFMCKSNGNIPTCFTYQNNGVLLASAETEIFWFDGSKIEHKGFLMYKIERIISLEDNKLLGITKDGEMVSFSVNYHNGEDDMEQKTNFEGKRPLKFGAQISSNNGSITKKYNSQVNAENIEPSAEILKSSHEVDDYFRNKQIENIKLFKSKRYNSKIKFSRNKLIVQSKTNPIRISYGLDGKKCNTIETTQKIRKLFCCNDLLFVSFFDSFKIYDTVGCKNIYEHNKCIKNFYRYDNPIYNQYIMNTDNEFITDKAFYLLEYTIILSAFYNNYKLLFGVKEENYFLILCEGENLVTKTKIDADISMIHLNSKIYISTHNNIFSIYDYNLNVQKSLSMPSFRHCFNIGDSKLLVSRSGAFFVYNGDTFVKLIDIEKPIQFVSQLKEHNFFIRSSQNYIIELDMKKLNNFDTILNNRRNMIKMVFVKPEIQYMTLNGNNLLSVTNNKINVSDNTINYGIKKYKWNKIYDFSDMIFLDQNNELIIEQKVLEGSGKNAFEVNAKFVRKNKIKEAFTIQNVIYKLCKPFTNDIFMLAINSDAGSEIRFYKFGKGRVDYIFSRSFEEQIMCLDSSEGFLAIGFRNSMKICKLHNNLIITIYNEKILSSIKDIMFIKIKNCIYIIANDIVKGYRKYKVDNFGINVEFVDTLDVKLENICISNSVAYFYDSHKIISFDLRTCTIISEFDLLDTVLYLTVGSMLPFADKNIYINTNKGDLFTLIDLKCILSKEEYVSIAHMQSVVCSKNTILYDDKHLNCSLLRNLVTKEICEQVGFSFDRFIDILNDLDNKF